MTMTSASTVILLDQSSGPHELNVLLLQRAATVSAFPGVWVFPGGRVDAEDSDTTWLERVRPGPAMLARRMALRDVAAGGFGTRDYLKRMRIGAPDPDRWVPNSPSNALWSHWVAAVRECWEETGISLAGWGERDVLDFNELYYWGRLVPPPQVPRRFDTRFFIALIDRGAIKMSPSEFAAYDWMKVDEALELVPLANPTRYALARLKEFGTVNAMLVFLREGL
ncbi:MAG: NUDIX domain-containing protein [Thermaerobacter sp.]|nr:NUDIX domain-containing protein [Thermaerobacter sp.]